MSDIRPIVQRATRRIGLDCASRMLARALLGAAGVACLAIVVGKLFLLGMAIAYAIFAAACVALVLAVFLAVKRWPSEHEGALAIDDRLHLAERVSSAMAVSGSDAPMARAVVADGLAYARAIPVAKTFPVRLHREFWAAAGLACVALAMLAWLPQWDVLARQEKLDLARKEREALRQQATEMRRELVQLRKRATPLATSRLQEHLGDMESIIGRMEKGKVTRAEAMAQLSKLADSLKAAQKDMTSDSRLSGLMSKAAALEKDAQKQSFDMAGELAKAVEQKKFADAAAELNKLAQKTASGELSQEQMDKLGQELKALAASLSEMKELSKALDECSSCILQGELEKLGECAGKGAFVLDDLAKLQDELDILAACAGVCQGSKSGLGNRPATWGGTGIYSSGDSRAQGPGMGGPGIGIGGVAPVRPEEVQFQPDLIKGKIRPGRVVGSFFVDGKQLKGEAKADYAEEVDAARAEAAQALQQEQIPGAYENYVHDYFSSLREE